MASSGFSASALVGLSAMHLPTSPAWRFATIPATDTAHRIDILRAVQCTCSVENAPMARQSDLPRLVFLTEQEVAHLVQRSSADGSRQVGSDNEADRTPVQCSDILDTPHRSSGCCFVVVHTCLSAAPGAQAEITSRLHYLCALHTHLQKDAAPMTPSPFCRKLQDGRLALVLPDEFGVPLFPPSPCTRGFVPLETSLPTELQFAYKASAVSGLSASSVAPQATAAPGAPLRAMVDWLRLAVALTSELQRLHTRGVVHRGLHPSTIWVRMRGSGHAIAPISIQFQDLSRATRLQRSRADPSTHLELGPSTFDFQRWLFLAPEQSGKVNRVVDARTDLYSLGAIFHLLLTGRPPFDGGDTLELLHQHLARAPPSILPSQKASVALTSLQSGQSSNVMVRFAHSVLQKLNAVIGRLMAKQAEDRYQSATGLLHDLQALLSILQRAQSASTAATNDPTVLDGFIREVQAFCIGTLDVRSTFAVSQKLYGRSAQIDALIATYQCVSTRRTSAGIPATPPVAPHLFLISGYSGVGQCPSQCFAKVAVRRETTSHGVSSVLFPLSHSGKTSLVDALHKHIVHSRGLFARGKFDLLKRDSSCLLQSFRSLILQMIAGNAVVWKVKLGRALGPNAQALVEVLPELAQLLGEQPPLPLLGAVDTANRLNAVLMQFIGTVASASTPLTLLIDDLQWADSGSLALIRLLMSHERAHLLIIGAFRSNEVDAQHPLKTLIAELRSDEVRQVHSATAASADGGGGGDEGAASEVSMSSSVPSRIQEVQLDPLGVSDVAQLVADSFQCSPSDAEVLANVLIEKTQGNRR